MDLREWDERYRTAQKWEDLSPEPSRLLKEWAEKWRPGRALDLACGAGRNAAYLASLGWDVTGVDGAPSALESLQRRAPGVKTIQADLERQEFVIEPCQWDLILSCYYFQRDLFPAIKAGVRTGGHALAIVHTPRAAPGELKSIFEDWNVLHYYEGSPRDSAHHRDVAEIVASVPAC